MPAHTPQPNFTPNAQPFSPTRPTAGPRSQATTPFATLRKRTVITLLLVTLQLGLTALFVAYVLSHRVVRTGPTLWVSIPNNIILLISTIIARVPPLIAPLVMTMAAYGFAKDWLMSSALSTHHLDPDGPVQVGSPTPEQYSIALNVIGRADLGAAFGALKFLFRKRDRNIPSTQRPRWLTKSIIFLFSLTFLAYLVGGMDLYLHQSVLSVHLTTFTTSRIATTSFSRVINSTLCALENANPWPCASVSQGAHAALMVEPAEGLAAATNTSTINEVVALPNSSIALLLPASSVRAQNTFQATTFGTYTTCAPVSIECGLYAASGASTPYACLERPAFNGDITVVPSGSSVISSFNGSGTRLVGLISNDVGAWSQPLEFGIAAFLQSGAAFSLCFIFWFELRLCHTQSEIRRTRRLSPLSTLALPFCFGAK
jgi:hypothetical protein